MPGLSECPAANSQVFNTAAEASHSSLVSGPVRLSTDTSESSDHVSYHLGKLRKWLSASSAATICWRNDITMATPLKIGAVLWLGPVYGQKAISVNCGDIAVCTLTVQGKNLSKMNHSVSRLAVLETCGVAKGPGVAQASSKDAATASFFMMTQREDFVTEDDLQPGMLHTQPLTA